MWSRVVSAMDECSENTNPDTNKPMAKHVQKDRTEDVRPTALGDGLEAAADGDPPLVIELCSPVASLYAE